MKFSVAGGEKDKSALLVNDRRGLRGVRTIDARRPLRLDPVRKVLLPK